MLSAWKQDLAKVKAGIRCGTQSENGSKTIRQSGLSLLIADMRYATGFRPGSGDPIRTTDLIQTIGATSGCGA